MATETYDPKTYPSKPRFDAQGNALTPTEDVVDYVRAYARQQPEKAALWCLGVGFVLGWKLKPW